MKAAHEDPCIPRSTSSPVRLILCMVLILGLFIGGCTNMVAQHFEKTVDITKGTMNLPGLTEPVTVRRDALGIPFIEAKTMGDMAMAMGYVHASDRLTQMAAIRLMSEGRLSEMAGPSMIDLDLYMRTMNLRQTALILLKNISPENLALLERYCTGVNAYLDRIRTTCLRNSRWPDTRRNTGNPSTPSWCMPCWISHSPSISTKRSRVECCPGHRCSRRPHGCCPSILMSPYPLMRQKNFPEST